jgi:hypothetical protein
MEEINPINNSFVSAHEKKEIFLKNLKEDSKPTE